MKKLIPLLIVLCGLVLTMGLIGCEQEPDAENDITLDLVNDTGATVFVDSTYVGTTNVFSLFGTAVPPLPAAVTSPAGPLVENLALPGGLFVSVYGYHRLGVSPNYYLDPAYPEYTSCFDLSEPAHYECEFFDEYADGLTPNVEDYKAPGTVVVTNLDTTEIVPEATCP